MYTIASTSIVNSLTTFVACCPSSYTFYGTQYETLDPIFQCASSVSIGQTLKFDIVTDIDVFVTNTTVNKDIYFSVYAVPINGYVFADATTSTSQSKTSTAGAIVPQTPTIPQTSTPLPATTSISTLNVNSSTSGLSTGAKIGICVGTSLAVLGFCGLIVAFFLIRRSKNSIRQHERGSLMETRALTPELPDSETIRRKPVASQRASATTTATQTTSPRAPDTIWEDPDASNEGEQVQQEGVHEMGATLQVPFSDSNA
ncbi:uncharacterized protein LY89DRAFT_728152 [Mollisia scopiformis]|uniref:Mid2 domain-containing protein n=1 Tax=Mollisia scopiformis TaxID=149040 RepID=A0A194XTC9_MOLSC|nr:uncharacterized protein LY89DRAFT_728152 [Mollisia scopiformis]KUJ23401.1 hypothetical protein LY89DRAFT_728152 [Mollisia scopiformis]